MMIARTRAGLLALALAGAALALPASAGQNPRGWVTTQVSGANPLPECTAYPTNPQDLAAYRDWDQEPTLAVSPINPERLVAAWMTGWSDGIATARSDDGGSTWAVSGVPLLDCTRFHSAFDPVLASGLDVNGVAEVAYLVANTATPPSGAAAPLEALRPPSAGQVGAPYPDSTVVVVSSYDGGRNWARPTELLHAKDYEAIDGPHVAADPTHPGTAYVLWSLTNIATYQRDEYVARTVDGGRTWGSPQQLPRGPVGTDLVGTRLVVTAHGDLAAVSAAWSTAQLIVDHRNPVYHDITGPTTLVVTTAAFGKAWTPRRTITTVDAGRFTDVGVGADRSGRITAAWVRVAGPDIQPVATTSLDGGLTWGPEQRVGDPIASRPFLAGADIIAPPTVLLNASGAPTLVFYDHRNDDPKRPADSAPKTTDVRSRSLTTGGWDELQAFGPFDGTTGPAGDGSYCDGDACAPAYSVLGDYFGGATLGKGALGVMLVGTHPIAGSPHNTEVYFARLDHASRGR